MAIDRNSGLHDEVGWTEDPAEKSLLLDKLVIATAEEHGSHSLRVASATFQLARMQFLCGKFFEAKERSR